MHFYKTLLAGSLIAASAVAQLMFTSFPPSTVAVGTPVTVTWTGAAPGVPVTIKLRKGPRGDLSEGIILTNSATGSIFTFTLDSTLVNGSDYVLEIDQGGEQNFSGPFAVTGGSGVSSATSSATTRGLSTVSSSTSITSSAKSSSETSSSSLTSSSASSTSTSTSTSHTTTSTSVASSSSPGAATSLSSPFALVLGALAAFVYLN